MKLNLTSKYKSLDPFTFELPDFTILTGLNGSGKTQILTAIIEGRLMVEDGDILATSSMKHVTNLTLAPNDTDAMRGSANYNFNVTTLFKLYRNYYAPEDGKHKPNPSSDSIYRQISDRLGKRIEDLSQDDFYRYYPLVERSVGNDIFKQQLDLLFKRYHHRREGNKFNIYRVEKYGDNKEVVSDDEFIKLHGEPPWEIVNQILSEAKLDFQVNFPEGEPSDERFVLKLINTKGEEIYFRDLSSGEKVLMSLAFSLFNSKLELEFPRLLLMDETDASLHPSMTKQLLDVLENVFVKNKGVKVIMTTHSPSTVALASEESIYVVNKTGDRIVKASKDQALKTLTAGVPTFSVNYENRRQVFVESKYDVQCFERIYSKLSDKLIDGVSLGFISSGVGGSGNCDQVFTIVNQLREYGNRFIYGIIDWDLKNKSTDCVRVLGENIRYGIENYIFDPLLISALLLREKVIDKEVLGLANNEAYTDFKRLSPDRLQSITDYLTKRLGAKLQLNDYSRAAVRYVSDLELQIPIWYLQYQGHELEALLKEQFPKLRRFGKEGDLKLEVIDKIMDDLPELIPADVFHLF